MYVVAPQGGTVSAEPDFFLKANMLLRRRIIECRTDLVLLYLCRRSASATCLFSVPKLVQQIRARRGIEIGQA